MSLCPLSHLISGYTTTKVCSTDYSTADVCSMEYVTATVCSTEYVTVEVCSSQQSDRRARLQSVHCRKPEMLTRNIQTYEIQLYPMQWTLAVSRNT
jgi:hypothetical protein